MIANIIPPPRNGNQQVTRELRRRIVKEYSRIRVVQSDEETDHRELSIDRDSKTISLFGESFPLECDLAAARSDAKLLVDFFRNYEGTFEGGMGVERLQRDYFILWSWLYFSPFMCDMRTLAGHDGDIFRFPSFAIVYGKPSCGKSSLIDTLMTSMFGKAYNVDKREFTKSRLRDIQFAYKRFPAVFDDIGKPAIRNHGEDAIKDENPPLVAEYPCFVLSMNQELKAFTDQNRKAQPDDLHDHRAPVLQREPSPRPPPEDSRGASRSVHPSLPGILEKGPLSTRRGPQTRGLA